MSIYNNMIHLIPQNKIHIQLSRHVRAFSSIASRSIETRNANRAFQTNATTNKNIGFNLKPIDTISQSVRFFGTRGSRGHGWYVNYCAGKGGRHLQGEYHDRESEEQCHEWNNAILELGSKQVYLDVVMEPIQGVQLDKRVREAPDLNSLTGEKFRLTIDLATTVMPETTQNFIDLCTQSDEGYAGTIFYRVEKKVGLCGGDVFTNTGKAGKAANGAPLLLDIKEDPLAMWHVPGTVTMIVPKVGSVDSRFMFCSKLAQHLDGIHRAFGRLTPESLAIVQNWEATLLTRKGVPTSYDLVIADCGLVDGAVKEEAA